MSLKLMIFIDGTWLYQNRNQIAAVFNKPEFRIDYRKLPLLVANQVAKTVNTDVQTVRTHFFSSIPKDKPDYDPSQQQRFYDYLERECHYAMEIYTIDFRNGNGHQPEEKCVDVALASSMMYYAALSNAYDVAALVGGDFDYFPLLKRVRLLGKRTMLVAFRVIGDSHPTSRKLLEDYSLFDFPILYLDDFLPEIEFQRREQLRVCDTCGQKKLTSWEGDTFFCDDCRKDFSRGRKKSYRSCERCGKLEETVYQGDVFYCSDCRNY